MHSHSRYGMHVVCDLSGKLDGSWKIALVRGSRYGEGSNFGIWSALKRQAMTFDWLGGGIALVRGAAYHTTSGI